MIKVATKKILISFQIKHVRNSMTQMKEGVHNGSDEYF